MDDQSRTLSRRELLKLAGAAGITPVAPIAPAHRTEPVAPVAPSAPVAAQESLRALTQQEARLLDAIVARLIPSDASGPGAREANAVRFIDRALAGALSGSREAYRVGLAAFDRYARSSRGKPFTELSPT